MESASQIVDGTALTTAFTPDGALECLSTAWLTYYTNLVPAPPVPSTSGSVDISTSIPVPSSSPPPPPSTSGSDLPTAPYNTLTFASLGRPGVDCFPSSKSGSTVVWSPGVCPSGYTIAVQSSIPAIVSGSPAIASSGVCCPLGYLYTLPGSGNRFLPCISGLPTTAWTSVFGTTYGSGTAAVTTNTTIEWIGSSIHAEGVNIQWACSDSSLLSSFPEQFTECSNQGRGASTDDTSMSGTPNPSMTGTGSDGRKNLSGGGIAGVVLGSIFGLLAVIGALLYVLKRRKAKSSVVENQVESEVVHEKGVDAKQVSPPHEMGIGEEASHPQELEARESPQEMGDGHDSDSAQ